MKDGVERGLRIRKRIKRCEREREREWIGVGEKRTREWE